VVSLETFKVSNEKIIAQLKEAVKNAKEGLRFLLLPQRLRRLQKTICSKRPPQRRFMQPKKCGKKVPINAEVLMRPRDTFIEKLDQMNQEMRSHIQRYSLISVSTKVASLESEITVL
jgi:hypothetical protein